MQIGTAAPTPDELAPAPHHFIHNKSIHDNYSVGTFEKEAIQCLNTLFKTKDVVVMVGGSGLYVDAVNNGLDHFPTVDASIREKLNTTLAEKGIEHLQEQLKELDITSYNTIALDNPHRLIRALEICIGSGQPYSSFLNKDKGKRPFKTITVGLTADRPIMYDRINRRVDIMMHAGLLEEVKTLLPYQELNALNTVGYKEIFNYLNGEWTLEFATSEIQKNSRRFAKRQLTWFKRNTETLWFDYLSDIKSIIQAINSKLEN